MYTKELSWDIFKELWWYSFNIRCYYLVDNGFYLVGFGIILTGFGFFGGDYVK